MYSKVSKRRKVLNKRAGLADSFCLLHEKQWEGWTNFPFVTWKTVGRVEKLSEINKLACFYIKHLRVPTYLVYLLLKKGHSQTFSLTILFSLNINEKNIFMPTLSIYHKEPFKYYVIIGLGGWVQKK